MYEQVQRSIESLWEPRLIGLCEILLDSSNIFTLYWGQHWVLIFAMKYSKFDILASSHIITYFIASLESSNRSPTPRLVNYFITSSINKRILLLLVVCTLHPMSQACVFIMLCIEDNSQELWWLVRWILWLCVVLISPSRRVSTNVHTLFSRGEFLQQSRNPRHQKELHTKWYVYSIPYVKIGLRVDDKQNTI